MNKKNQHLPAGSRHHRIHVSHERYYPAIWGGCQIGRGILVTAVRVNGDVGLGGVFTTREKMTF